MAAPQIGVLPPPPLPPNLSISEKILKVAVSIKDDPNQLFRIFNIVSSTIGAASASTMTNVLGSVCFQVDIDYFVNRRFWNDLTNKGQARGGSYIAAQAAYLISDVGATYMSLKAMGFNLDNAVTNAIGNSQFFSGVSLSGVVSGFGAVGAGLCAVESGLRAWNAQRGSRDQIKGLLDLATNVAAVAASVLAYASVGSAWIIAAGVMAASFGLISFSYGVLVPPARQQINLSLPKIIPLVQDAVDNAGLLAAETGGIDKEAKLITTTLDLKAQINGPLQGGPAGLRSQLGSYRSTLEALGVVNGINDLMKDGVFPNSLKIAKNWLVTTLSSIELLNIWNILNNYFSVPKVDWAKTGLGTAVSGIGFFESARLYISSDVDVGAIQAKLNKWTARFNDNDNGWANAAWANRMRMKYIGGLVVAERNGSIAANAALQQIAVIAQENDQAVFARWLVRKQAKVAVRLANWQQKIVNGSTAQQFFQMKVQAYDNKRINAPVVLTKAIFGLANDGSKLLFTAGKVYLWRYGIQTNVYLAGLAVASAVIGVAKFLFEKKNSPVPLPANAIPATT